MGTNSTNSTWLNKKSFNVKDEYYTPSILVEPILKYIKPNSVVWCPFDTKNSEFVIALKKAGHKVIYSHIWYGQDFFEYEPDEKYDYIISNPPFSKKLKVFERLYKLNKPFAMICGLPILNYQEIGEFFVGKENSAENKYGKDGSFQRLTKGFMGKEWDGTGIEYNVDFWAKCYNVLKPGGYLLAFGGSRTYHRIACAIEDAGFEIRDTIMWLYGSGFPKSLNIGLAIDKKNGIESETIGNGKSGVSSRAYQSEETTTAGEYEIKKANNKNDYLKLIEEELKKQGVENIEWK